VQKILADAAFQRDGSFKIAANLTEYIACGDWPSYYTLEEKTRKVTPADVKRVANIYLQENQSVTGWFIPVVEAEPAGTPPPAAPIPAGFKAEHRSAGPYFYRDPLLFAPASASAGDASRDAGGAAATRNEDPNTSSSFARNVIREKIDGIDVLLYRTGVKDVVTFRAALPAGDSMSPSENQAIATLVGSLLDKGTTKEDKFSIAQKLEGVGATLRFGVDNYMVTASGQCLRKDVPLLVSILAE
jgi:zinc protease